MHIISYTHVRHVTVIIMRSNCYLADFGDALFLLADVDLPRSCCGDLAAAARLRLLDSGTADFLGLEATADDFDFGFDFAGDFCTGEDFAGADLAAAAGERALPRVMRFSADDGVFVADVFEADRLALRGILTILQYTTITSSS